MEQKVAPIVREIDGIVKGAEVADLDRNQSPEIYIYVNSAGSGTYGSLLAMSANNRKSLTEIYLPEISTDTKLSKSLSEEFMLFCIAFEA